jgi:hypothetical protein
VGTIGPKSGQRLKGPIDGFDTPTLLGVWQTPPYLHDGSAATLADVFTRVGAEAHAGRPLAATEVEDLTAYLLQIDGLPDVGQPPMAGAGGMGGSGGVGGDAGLGGVAGIEGMAGSGGLAGGPDTPPPAAITEDDSGSGCSISSNGRAGTPLNGLGALLALAVLRIRHRLRVRPR